MTALDGLAEPWSAARSSPAVRRSVARRPRGVTRTRGDVAEVLSTRVIPWLIFALVAVPLVVAGFVVTRRRTVAAEHPANEDAQATARTEQEFADAEAFEAKWREEDKERYHQERLP